MNPDALGIIDPIHGFVRAYETEQKLILNPAFQRLRRIRQLSSTHLVYPGAQHTRFEHSLGVMHVAGMAGHALAEKGAIDSEKIIILKLAGLLHDIGHGPFSHMFETLGFGGCFSHEEMGRKIIETTEIAEVISSTGYEPKDVTATAFGGNSTSRYMNEILSGYLSADMMDYLLRDAQLYLTKRWKVSAHALFCDPASIIFQCLRFATVLYMRETLRIKLSSLSNLSRPVLLRRNDSSCVTSSNITMSDFGRPSSKLSNHDSFSPLAIPYTRFEW